MKRVCCAFLMLLMLLLSVLNVYAAESPASAQQIPIDKDEPFPAAVDTVLIDKAYIAESERLSQTQINYVIDSCRELLADENVTLVSVDTQTVMQIPSLKQRATVECSAEYVYSTYYNRGVKYEWIHYLDGRVEKTVSYKYEERTAEFEKRNYMIVNDNNETLREYSFEVEEEDVGIHVTDMLFGMAIAVFLMMVILVIVKKIKGE